MCQKDGLKTIIFVKIKFTKDFCCGMKLQFSVEFGQDELEKIVNTKRKSRNGVRWQNLCFSHIRKLTTSTAKQYIKLQHCISRQIKG